NEPGGLTMDRAAHASGRARSGECRRRSVYRRWRPRSFGALFFALLLAPCRTLADAGIATHKSDPSKDANGMKAKTFFELLDASLGKKFNSLVLVFGGCFTSDFTSKAETSAVGTSGKPVAVLAATDRNDSTQFAGG